MFGVSDFAGWAVLGQVIGGGGFFVVPSDQPAPARPESPPATIALAVLAIIFLAALAAYLRSRPNSRAKARASRTTIISGALGLAVIGAVIAFDVRWWTG